MVADAFSFLFLLLLFSILCTYLAVVRRVIKLYLIRVNGIVFKMQLERIQQQTAKINKSIIKTNKLSRIFNNQLRRH